MIIPTSMRGIKRLEYYIRKTRRLKQEDAQEEAAWIAGYNSYRDAKHALGSSKVCKSASDDGVR